MENDQVFITGLITGGALILVGLFAWWMNFVEKKRREGLARAAQLLGFSFAESDDLLASQFAAFELFESGHSRKYRNVMRGRTDDADATLFDYTHTTGHGKNSHTTHQTVAAFRLGTRELPAFRLRPENIFHKIGSVFGYQDIDFPNFSTFSNAYLLRAKDENAVRSLFIPPLLQGLENQTGWHIEGNGPTVILYKPGGRIEETAIPAFLDETRTIHALFPRNFQP